MEQLLNLFKEEIREFWNIIEEIAGTTHAAQLLNELIKMLQDFKVELAKQMSLQCMKELSRGTNLSIIDSSTLDDTSLMLQEYLKAR
jgi:hypothetical protein